MVVIVAGLIFLSGLNIYILIALLSEATVFKINSLNEIRLRRAFFWPKYITKLNNPKEIFGFILATGSIVLIVVTFVFGLMKVSGYGN